MSMYKNLTTVCAAAVLALGLAACGGGGDDDDQMTMTPEMCPEGQTGTPPDCMTPPPPGPTAESLKADAADAITAAQAAGRAADKAMKDAIKYAGMLDTASVNGDSAMATANAQKVLDAEMTANDAVEDADDALQDAMDAKEAAEALPEDDEDRVDAIAAADEAIKQATAQKKAAMAIVDAEEDATNAPTIDSLKGAVAMVKGAVMDMPNDAAHHGQTVAMAIGAALGPTSGTDGSGLRVEDLANAAPTGDAAENAVTMNDHTGMTWAEIVGEDNLMDSRIGANRASVKIASISGMTADDVAAAIAQDTDGYDDGQEFVGASYMGIPGAAYCLGSDCKVTDGKLAGSWYFTPTSPMVYYEKVGEATTYTPETNYAQFGHWLVVDPTNGEATVHRYAAGGVTNTNTAGLDVTTVNREPDATTLTDDEATYSGTAAGMSLHKEIDAQGNAVKGSLSSGAFTANVRLTAKFGTSPMLGGMIDGFTSVNGGNNVDSSWSVKLTDSAFTAAAVSDGTADASGQDGTWSAQGYGTTGQRPTGIYGGFNAHFTDGHAAGAYATRKQQ